MTTTERPALLAPPTVPTGEPPLRVADRAQVETPPAGRPAPALTSEKRRLSALVRFAVSITVLNILGHLLLGFEQAPLTPVVTVLASYAAHIAFEWIEAWSQQRPPEFLGGVRAMAVFLLPAHITALACAMLLYGNDTMWPYVFAVVVAAASKHVVRVRARGRLRHVLNPSNTGIVAALLLFPWVGIAPPYHFTNVTGSVLDWLLPLTILGLGTMLNLGLTGRMPLILGWVGGFVAQAVVRWLVFDHHLLAALAPITGLAFVLFTNYMITDPGTTPSGRWRQVGFGLTVAAVYGVLVVSGVVFGLFFALVITCTLRGITLVVGPRLRAARYRAGKRRATPTPRSTDEEVAQ